MSRSHTKDRVKTEERCQESAKKCGESAEIGPFTFTFNSSGLHCAADFLHYSPYISNRAVFQDRLQTILRVHVNLPTCRAIPGQWQYDQNFPHRGNIQKAPSTMLYASNLIRWLQRKRYQYEVTFSLYMLTPMEKFIFSTFPLAVIEITNLRACRVLRLP